MDRREFMGATVSAGAAVALGPLARAGGLDLVLSEVEALVDGSFKPCDIGVSAGRIESIAEPGSLEGREKVPCKGLYASPGWCDLHVHYVDWRHGKSPGSPIKRLGTELGVTALVDAGTTGAANFHRLENAINDGPDIPCFAFIYITREGIKISDFYMTRPGWEDIEAMEKCLEKYGQRIVGIKYRADHQVSPKNDRLYYVRKCREAGDALGLPVMIHIGVPPPSLPEILPHLKEGDMITHCFRGEVNSLHGDDGKLLPEVADAIERGVRFDVGHGMGSFTFNSLERALDQDFVDFTVSSDLYIMSTRLYAKTFANVLTQFLAAGMPLPDIMERASTRPARFLGLEREIKPGAEATMSVFKVARGDFTCMDVNRDTRKSDKRIIPEWTVMQGREIKAGEFDRKMFM